MLTNVCLLAGVAASDQPAPWLVLALTLAGIPIFGLLIMALIARVSGWTTLSMQYPASEPISGTRWHGQSAELARNCNYGGCVTFWANERGFGLVPFFLFRFQHPPLFIPWRDVSVQHRRWWVFEFVRLEVGRSPPLPITISPRLAKRLSDAAGSAWPERADAVSPRPGHGRVTRSS